MSCFDCSAPAEKGGFCRTHRLLRWVDAGTKYRWTPAMDEHLTRIYRGSKNKPTLSLNIKDLMKRYGLPRCVVSNRAQTLGLRIHEQRRWGKQEVEMLREFAGSLSLTKLAKALRRSESSVKNKMFLLGLSCDVTEGFSMNQLAQLFGVHHHKISVWVGRGWLDMDGELVTEESVQRFVWKHMEEYRFASCEEWWLKTMLNPEIGRAQLRRAA